MKKMIMSAMLITSVAAFAQNSAVTTEAAAKTEVAKATTAAKASKKSAKKAQKKKSAKAGDMKASQEAAINQSAPVETIAAPAAQADAASVVAAPAAGQTSTTATEAQPQATKKFGGEISITSDSTAKLAWQDAEQSLSGYVAVKYKQDKQNSFAIRQMGSMTMVGSNSKAGAVSTGKAGNTMLLYTRGMGSMFKSDDAASTQYRITLPTNDSSGYDIASFSASMSLPYTISPKWSAEYGIRLAMGFNSNSDKNSISAAVNGGQISYSINDKLQVYQGLSVTNSNLRTADTNKLGLETGVQVAPTSAMLLAFSISQEHGVGAGATEFNLYNVNETSYGSMLYLNF